MRNHLRPGAGTPGRLVLNPDDAEVVGYRRVKMAEGDGALASNDSVRISQDILRLFLLLPVSCLRAHDHPGMTRRMKASNSGTVNAVSP